MDKKYTRICICCGQQYEYCVKCDRETKKETWKNNYDIASCRDVFNTITDYRAGVLTKEEAADALRIIPLEHRATYVKGIAEFVDELLGDVDKTVKAQPKVAEQPKAEPEKPAFENKAEVKAETVDAILSHNKTDKMEKNNKREGFSFSKKSY